MALVANHNIMVEHTHGSLHQDTLARYPRYYTGQETVERPSSPPFVYTGPPLQITNGSRKAKKVLGLVAQFEKRHGAEEEDERDGQRKAQRTLGHVTEVPRDRRAVRKGDEGYKSALEEQLARAEREIRRMSRMRDMVAEQRDEADAADDERSDDERNEISHPQPSPRSYRCPHQPSQDDIKNDEEQEPKDHEKLPILELPIYTSPQRLTFPSLPIELDAGPDHELLLAPPRPRPRPHSYTSPPRRSTNNKTKIASSRSRGLRANSSPPNFSRPLEHEVTPIPGEDMERDPLSVRFKETEDDPREPLSPIGGRDVAGEIRKALERVEMGMSAAQEKGKAVSPEVTAVNRRSKPRWSSLPTSLMKFAAKKRSSSRAEEGGRKEVVTLTEENLARWEGAVGRVPRLGGVSGCDTIVVERTSTIEKGVLQATMPLMMQVAQAAMITPPTSPPLRQHQRSSSNGSTIGAHYTPTLSVAETSGSGTITPSTAMRSSTTSMIIRRFPEPPSQPSLAQQKETLQLKPNQLLTCALCGEVEHPSAFPAQPLSKACLHAGRVCKECVAGWVEEGLRDVAGVKCPECGVGVGVGEIREACGEEILRRLL